MAPVCVNVCNPGDNKPHFIPGMMGPFLGVTLVPQTEVRNIMIPIFHDMMDWEQRKNGNFKQVIVTLLCNELQIVCHGKSDSFLSHNIPTSFH